MADRAAFRQREREREPLWTLLDREGPPLSKQIRRGSVREIQVERVREIASDAIPFRERKVEEGFIVMGREIIDGGFQKFNRVAPLANFTA